MAGTPYVKQFTFGGLAAASANNIALSQAGTANTALTLNGSAASGGVATLDQARKVIVTSAGNDSGITFAIAGTDWNGHAISETLTGANIAAAQSRLDYKTVTSVVPSGATAANVTVGTNTVASSPPIIFDYFANPALYRIDVVASGTINWQFDETIDDISPDYNLVNYPNIDWFQETAFANQTSSVRGQLTGPLIAGRITINSGTGSVAVRIAQSMGDGNA